MSRQQKKISNVEWGLLIGALFCVDIIQWVLIWLGIGLLFNEFIDIGVDLFLLLYQLLRGLLDWTNFLLLAAGALGEAATDGGAPLWGLEGILMFTRYKTKQNLPNLPI